jgi:hypothetical protein
MNRKGSSLAKILNEIVEAPLAMMIFVEKIGKSHSMIRLIPFSSLNARSFRRIMSPLT